MILFNLVFAFVAGLGVFGTSFDAGVVATGNASDTFNETTNLNVGEGTYGMESLWSIVMGGAVGALSGLVVAWLTKSTNAIGAFIFGAVFWASFMNTYSIININEFLTPLWGFVIIMIVGMFFIFTAAIVGMFSGSG